MSEAGQELSDEPELFQGDPNRPMLIDRDGNPMSPKAWADAFEDTEGRIIARDFVGDREVRTMWHGITDGDFLCGWSTNTGIFGSIICVLGPEGGYIPDLSTTDVSKLKHGLATATTFGREIVTGTLDDALAAHQELLRELRGSTT